MEAKRAPRIDLENRTRLETVLPLNTPFIINVDPSDGCNFRCKFCPTGDRALMKTAARPLKAMDFGLYRKIIDDIREFESPLKVLRLYKDGEPLLNPRFAEMVRYAKKNPNILRVDTTTNASLLTPGRNREIIEAGIDRINISVEGVTEKHYEEFSDYKIKFDLFMETIAHLYAHRANCEIVVKINGDILSEGEESKFIEMFSDKADRVHIEHVMSCWPEFKLRGGMEVNQQQGIYGQAIHEVSVCPYVFYSFSINSDGQASACFLDWSRKLIIGDAKVESVKNIWHGRMLREYQGMFLRFGRKKHPVCGQCGQMTHGMPDDIDSSAPDILKRLADD